MRPKPHVEPAIRRARRGKAAPRPKPPGRLQGHPLDRTTPRSRRGPPECTDGTGSPPAPAMIPHAARGNLARPAPTIRPLLLRQSAPQRRHSASQTSSTPPQGEVPWPIRAFCGGIGPSKGSTGRFMDFSILSEDGCEGKADSVGVRDFFLNDRGRDDRLSSATPTSEPYVRFSRILCCRQHNMR